jgi:hypothetical protein
MMTEKSHNHCPYIHVPFQVPEKFWEGICKWGQPVYEPSFHTAKYKSFIEGNVYLTVGTLDFYYLP